MGVLQSITEYYRVIQSITEYYRVLQSITKYCRVLQSIAEDCRVLQSITEYYRILQNITEYYRVFLVHLLGSISGLVSCGCGHWGSHIFSVQNLYSNFLVWSFRSFV